MAGKGGRLQEGGKNLVSLLLGLAEGVPEGCRQHGVGRGWEGHHAITSMGWGDGNPEEGQRSAHGDRPLPFTPSSIAPPLRLLHSTFHLRPPQRVGSSQ